ncbi:MAG: heavy metal-binding domain-containing protein [Candidatus Bathyarchaeia archaeon]
MGRRARQGNLKEGLEEKYFGVVGMICPKCGAEVAEGTRFCPKCGSPLSQAVEAFLITTTPSIPGYRIKKVLGVVTGLTPRTRGVLGKFLAGIQTMFGGEVTAFTKELEKAKTEAIERIKGKALALGANAIVGLDLETSDLGLQAGVVVVSATGTAVIVEPE